MTEPTVVGGPSTEVLAREWRTCSPREHRLVTMGFWLGRAEASSAAADEDASKPLGWAREDAAEAGLPWPDSLGPE